ncbi:hypothetical protein MTO96_028972 [Rhipicephalus appendiculatus]
MDSSPVNSNQQRETPSHTPNDCSPGSPPQPQQLRQGEGEYSPVLATSRDAERGSGGSSPQVPVIKREIIDDDQQQQEPHSASMAAARGMSEPFYSKYNDGYDESRFYAPNACLPGLLNGPRGRLGADCATVSAALLQRHRPAVVVIVLASDVYGQFFG